MVRKKWFLLGMLVCMIAFATACTSKETSKPEKEKANETEKSEVGGLVVSGDTVSEQGGCVLASRFTAGDKIVFRMDAIDPTTNKQVEDAKLQVHLSTGEVLDMVYGEHPPGEKNAAKFWTAAYPVTEDTPTGTLEYYVTAEAGGKKAEFRPFNVAPSLLSIVDAQAVNEGAKKEKEKKSEDKANVETNQNVDIIATNFKFNKDKFYVKAGEEVNLSLTSKEGIHGIEIEGLNVSISNGEGKTKFTPKKAGEYTIFCNTFCGEGHGNMKATLVVVE